MSEYDILTLSERQEVVKAHRMLILMDLKSAFVSSFAGFEGQNAGL
jgi:hypothetical protein